MKLPFYRLCPPLLGALLIIAAWTGCGGVESTTATSGSESTLSSNEPVAEPAEAAESADSEGAPGAEAEATANGEAPPAAEGTVATFGNGCFWCTEAIFERMEGVEKAVSGYMGGTVENPSYKMVCTGKTGHAEVVQVTYDPNVVSYEDLLKAFWSTHDPTTLNQQGHDIGTQYRSAVFFHNDSQRASAEYYMQRLEDEGAFDKPIVTEITKASTFYPAEQEHQDYYALNPFAGYCQAVIAPKVQKFKKAFGEQLKEEAK